MWLIHIKSLKLKEFFGNDIPAYVILSHTWGDEEVLFDDWERPEIARAKKGWYKIAGACQTASDVGDVEYIWIDNVCIDKRSSADLSEAINSMFSWYRNSRVCLVYLEDVHIPGSSTEERHRLYQALEPKPYVAIPSLTEYTSRFQRCKWFTRGWTLQELLAPQRVVFLSKHWRLVGNLPGLVEITSHATRIPSNILMKKDSLYSESIATRMSWAARRQTSRVEDMAYCLLGIFDINMPLLYGEGKKAFLRLQAEIIKSSTDHTIFTWQRRPWLDERSESSDYPIFAPSPNFFASRSELKYDTIPHGDEIHYTLTNSGLLIELPIVKTVTGGLILGVLNCGGGESPSRDNVFRWCMVLHRRHSGIYVRICCLAIELSMIGDCQTWEKLYIQESDISFSLEFHQLATLARQAVTPSAEAEPGIGASLPLFVALTNTKGFRYLTRGVDDLGLVTMDQSDDDPYFMSMLEIENTNTRKRYWISLLGVPGKQTTPRVLEWYVMKPVLLKPRYSEHSLRKEMTLLAKKHHQQKTQVPKWDVEMTWIPADCPLLIVNLGRTFA